MLLAEAFLFSIRCRSSVCKRSFILGAVNVAAPLLAGYGARKGLEGPFNIGGRVLYYDVKEGSYYDPKTDFYVPQEDVNYLHNELMRMLDKQGA